MFLHVTGVRHLTGFLLELEFNDGTVKRVDLTGELHGDIFEPQWDETLFRQVAVNEETNTIEWPNGADLSPEFLHRIGTPVERVA